MKVIICFGSVRVVVPCGDGESSVKEIMDKALHRYKKTLDKLSDVYVTILNLKTLDNNALLDPSDKLKDVVDDREQLIAAFAINGEIFHDERNGDGMSSGSPSPELHHAFHVCGKDFDPTREAIITSRDIASQDHNLVVRRCSDETISFPVVTSSTEIQHEKSSSLPSQMVSGHVSHKHSRRKVVMDKDHPILKHVVHAEPYNLPLDGTKNGFISKSSKLHGHVPLQNSMSCNLKASVAGPGGYVDSNKNGFKKSNLCNRQSPYSNTDHHFLANSSGGSNHSEPPHLQDKVVSAKDMLGISMSNHTSGKERFVVKLKKGSRGLGFSITTQDNKTSEESSLIFIKKILPSGSAIEDGRLQPGDCVLEVNGVSMTGKPQEEVVSLLRNIPIGENVMLLVARMMKPLHPPSQNFSEVTSPENRSKCKMDFNRSCSKETLLHSLGKKQNDLNSKSSCQDTDSILSFESELRSSRPRFTREGLGRQSMSEKRKGHVDPRATETFGKIQSRRSEIKGNIHHSRSGSVDSVIDRAGNIETSFSSSCKGVLGGFRSRAMNYSFRAAIDKCLDGDDITNSPGASCRADRADAGSRDQQVEHKVAPKSFGAILKYS